MPFKTINPESVSAPVGGYSHGLGIQGPGKLFFISGQIPEDMAGEVPADFAGQCEIVWQNIAAILKSGGMTFANLVKVNTYLSERTYAEENGRIRRKYLGVHRPALTVVVVDILDPKWLLEIEAVAFSEN
jgi:2-iminobutanoate/2-iminopropanoate deaminase